MVICFSSGSTTDVSRSAFSNRDFKTTRMKPNWHKREGQLIVVGQLGIICYQCTSVWERSWRWLSICPRKTSTWQGSILWNFLFISEQKNNNNNMFFFVVIDAALSPASKDIQDEEEVTPVLSLWWHPWFPPFFLCCPHPWLQGVFIMVNSFHFYITSNVCFSLIFLLPYHSLQAWDPVTQSFLRFPLPSNAAHPEQGWYPWWALKVQHT